MSIYDNVLPSLARREPVSNWAEEMEKVKEAEENNQQSGAVAGVSALRPDAPSFVVRRKVEEVEQAEKVEEVEEEEKQDIKL